MSTFVYTGRLTWNNPVAPFAIPTLLWIHETELPAGLVYPGAHALVPGPDKVQAGTAYGIGMERRGGDPGPASGSRGLW